MFLQISQNSQENTCVRVSFLIKLQASGFPLPNAKHGSELMTSWPKEQQIYKNYLKTLKKIFQGGGKFYRGKKGEKGEKFQGGIFTSPTWTNTVFSTKMIILHTFSSISLISNSRWNWNILGCLGYNKPLQLFVQKRQFFSQNRQWINNIQ